MNAAGALVPDNNYNVEFKIYSVSSGGTALWTEDWLVSGSTYVRVANGYLTASLGTNTAFSTASIPWGQPLWLTMNIGGTAGTPSWDGEMSPRLSLTSVPSAMALTGNSGANTATLRFASSIGQDTAVTLPDPGASTATVCYQNATACGFAVGTAGSFIQNGTSVQSAAKFNIVSDVASSPVGKLQAAASATAPVLLVKGGATPGAGGDVLALQDSSANALFTVGATGTMTVIGGLSPDITTAASASGSANGITVQPGSSGGASSNGATLTLKAGDASGTTSVTAGTVAIQGGNATGASGTRNGGSVTIDGGTGANANGSVTIGGTNAAAINIGHGTITTTVTGALTVAGGAITLNQNSNNNTSINTGTSTGQVNIGNSVAGAISLQSGNALTIAATNFNLATNGVATFNGGQTADITTVGAATATTITVKPGTSSGASSNGAVLTLQGGDASGTTAVTGGVLSLLGGNATGASGTRNGGSVNIDAGTGVSANGAITIGTTNAVSVTIGSPTVNIANAATTGSTVNVLGDATATGNTDTLNLATGNTAGTGSKAVHIADGTPAGTGTNTVTIGSLGNASATTLQAGTGNINLTTNQAGAGTIVKTATNNSVTAFQIQNAIGSNVLQADTTPLNTNIDSGNGSFEGTVSGWALIAGATGTVGRDTTQHYIGAASLKIALTSTAIGDGVKYTPASFAANTSYVLSFFIKQTAGTDLATNFAFGYNNGSDHNCTPSPSVTAQSVTTGTAGWVRFTCSFTTAASPAPTYIYWKESDAPASARTWFLDGVQFEQVATGVAQPFTDSKLQLNGVITSPAIFQNTTDSTTAFQVQNAAGTSNLLTLDTLNGRVNVGAANQASLSVSSALLVQNNVAAQKGLVVMAASGQSKDILDVADSTGAFLSGFDQGGNLAVKSSVTIGSGTTAGSLLLEDATGNKVTLKTVANLGGSINLILPAVATNSVICTDGGNCTLQTAYNASTGGASTTPTIKMSSAVSTINIQDADTSLGGGTNFLNFRSSNGAGLGNVVFGFGIGGNFFEKPTTDSTTTVQIQNNAANNLFVIDSSGKNINIGSTGSGSAAYNGSTTNIETSPNANTATNIGSTAQTSGTATINIGATNTAGGASIVNIGSGASATSGTTTVTAKGALTLTGNAASTWSTGSGALTIQSAAAATWSTAAGALSLLGNGGINVDATSGTVAVGTVNDNPITLGTAAGGSTLTIGQSTATNIINIGNAQTGIGNVQTVNIATSGTGTGKAAVTIGDTNGASTLVLQAGTGNATGDINIGDQTTAGKIIDIGSVDNAGTSTVRIATGAAAQTVTVGSTNGASATTIQAGTGNLLLQTNASAASIQARSSTNSATAFQVQNAISANLFNVDTTDSNLIVNPGAEAAFGTEWAGYGTGGSVARTTTAGQFFSGVAAVSVTTGTTNAAGGKNNIGVALTSGTQYVLSFWAKLSSGTMTDLQVGISKDGTAGTEQQCGSNLTLSTATWTHFSCIVTPSASGSTSAYVFFRQANTGTSRTFFIDNVGLTASTNATTPSIKVGGNGPTTIFTLDQAAGSPITTGQTALLGSMFYNSTIGHVQCYEDNGVGGSWGDCGNTSLQQAYNNSTGSTTPEIILDSTRNGIDIQDKTGGSLGNTVPLLSVRGVGTASTLGASLFTVNGAGQVGIKNGETTGTASLNYDLSFGQNSSATTRTIGVETQATTATNGNGLTMSAGTGNTSGTGGQLALQAGGGGSSGAGGALLIQGGAAGGGNTNGGNITLQAGAKAGSGSAGTVLVKNSNDSTTAFNVQNAAGTSTILDVDTSGGQVGVGTAAPARTLHVFVSNTSLAAPELLVDQANAGGDTAIELRNTATAESFFIGQDSDANNSFSINSYTSAAGSPATIAHVQSTTSAPAGSATTIAQAFASNVTAGNLLVAVAAWDLASTSTASCGDSAGNSWSTALIKLDPTSGGGNNDGLIVCYAPNAIGGADTVTVTFGAAATSRYINISEYSGVAKVNPLDVTAANVNAGATGTDAVTSTASTTSQNGDLIYGTVYNDTGSSTSITAGTGFTQRSINSSLLGTEDKIQATAGSVAATHTFGAVKRYISIMATFKAQTSVNDVFSSSLFTLTQTGAATFKNSVDSTTAFQIQNAATTNTVLSADTTNNRIGIAMGNAELPSVDLSFGGGASRTIGINQNPSSGNGGNLTLQAGAANSTGTGGGLTLQGGAGAGSGQAGGTVTVNGGNAGASGNAQGGGFTVSGGTGAGTSSGGAISLTGGTGGATGAGGAITITGGTGGATSGAGGGVTVQGGTAKGATAGGTVTLQGGTAAAATAGSNGGGISIVGAAGTATGTGGAGGAVTIQGGSGGGTGNNAGGGISLQLGAATGTGAQGTFQLQNGLGATQLTLDPTNTNANLNVAVNSGAEVSGTFSTNWTQHGTATITRDTTSGEFASGTAGVKAATSAAPTQGVRNNVGTAMSASTTYVVSFSIKVSVALTTPNSSLSVVFSPDGTTSNNATCSTMSTSYGSINTSTFVKYTCSLTTTSTATTSSAYLAIFQNDSVSRNIFIDNLAILAQNTSGTQDVGDLKVGGSTSQGLTLFTLDTFAATPFSGANASLAGSMYFDTTAGKIQCYDGSSWGACGAAPNGIITLTPEYTGAVLNGSGIGTMTSDFCANSAALTVGTLCGTNDARNFYKWTSPQTGSLQEYDIYATYKLPTTFKNFVDDNTITLTARSDGVSTSNALVTFEVFKSTGSSITECGTETQVTSSDNTWQTVSSNGNENSTCGFTAGNNVIFKIRVKAKSNANAYVENLNFSYTNQ